MIGALVAAGYAAAQPPELVTAPAHPDAPAVPELGDTLDYRTSHGRTLRMTLVGTSGDRFLWKLSDITGAPRLVARMTQDAEFRVLVHQDAGGGVTRFEPHNCEKVVGICSYKVHNPDGSAADEMRVNGITQGVWNYSLWRGTGDDKRPVGIGEICYDAAGLSLRESWTDLESAAGYSVERIRPDGRLADCSGAAAPLE